MIILTNVNLIFEFFLPVSEQNTHRQLVNALHATTPGETEPISRFHKLHPDGVCNTLRAGTDKYRGSFTSPRPIHPSTTQVHYSQGSSKTTFLPRLV